MFLFNCIEISFWRRTDLHSKDGRQKLQNIVQGLLCHCTTAQPSLLVPKWPASTIGTETTASIKKSGDEDPQPQENTARRGRRWSIFSMDGQREKIWASKWSKARLFRLEEVKFFCTFELFSQGLPLPPTQETNTEAGLFQWVFIASKLAAEDSLRELSWGPIWEGAAGEEWVQTVRRTWPEQRQKTKWEEAMEIQRLTPN